MALFDILFSFKGFLLALLVFVPIEHLFPLHPEQKRFRRGWLTDMAHVVVSGFMIRAGLLVAILSAVALSEAAMPTSWRQQIDTQPLWAQLILVLLVADLGFYLCHRLFHAVPWLWNFHAVHHSSEAMDWLAAHRVHPVDQILTKSASLIPIFALGFSEAAIAIYAVLYQWQSLLVHSNVKLPFGPLRWLVASPEFHHWHHANQREAYDKNFSGQLPLWDIVFGTLHMPAGRMPDRYGVDDPVPPTYVGQFFYPFKRQGEPAGDEAPVERPSSLALDSCPAPALEPADR